MESFVVSDRQASTLDSAIAQAGREALQGKACRRDDEAKVESSMSNLQVLHYWDIASTATELRIRRLKWLQNMARFPKSHVLPLAALFGTCKGEQMDPALECTCADGSIGAGANPWTRQAFNDIASLQEIDRGADLLYGLNGKYVKLFTNKELASEFAEIDLDELRRNEVLCEVPPQSFHVHTRQRLFQIVIGNMCAQYVAATGPASRVFFNI